MHRARSLVAHHGEWLAPETEGFAQMAFDDHAPAAGRIAQADGVSHSHSSDPVTVLDENFSEPDG